MSEELTRIIFSGVETQKAWDAVINAGARNVLMSIHYLKSKGAKTIAKRLEKNPDVKIMIDSGAYTFLQKIDEYKKKPLSFWEDYIESYIEWAREHKDMVSSIVELDIDDIVGEHQVEEWRKKYWEPLKDEGINVIYVWHEIKGIKGWISMCKKYDYIGLSFASDNTDETMAMKMMRLAEKFKAKVHGFALTSIPLLIKTPFYTADSTTWLVGVQYGELNFFDGRKMTRLKKDKWKKMRTKYIKLGCDWDRLKAEDPDEMNKANVLAFMEAEKYVHKRLRRKMYWLNEAKKKKVVEEKQPTEYELIEQDIDLVQFPDLETWDKRENLEVIAKDMNINPKYSDDVVILANAVVDAITFVNAEQYEQRIQEVYTDEIISEITEQYLQEAISDRTEGIDRLTSFFSEVVTGNNPFFYTTSFNETEDADESEGMEEVAPRAVEREDYLIDEEMDEYEDLSMPEVEEYENELATIEVDNKPVRDDKGKFVKGQSKVRKPKNMYSEKFPKMACDTCYAAQSCPEFRPGAVCAFQKIFKKFDSRDQYDVQEQMVSMVNMNAERIQRVAIFEMLDGGMPDANLTGLMNQQMGWLQQLTQLRKSMQPISGIASAGETVTVNMQGEGILSKIFGVREDEGPKKTAKKDDDIIDGEFSELDDMQDDGGDISD